MADVSQGIITNGLGGDASNMILGQFHLGFFEGQVVIPPPPGGVGGAAPSQIPLRYRLEDPEEYPQDRKIPVTIKIRFGETWYERIYHVLPKDASIIVKAFNMLNTTMTRIKLSVANVQNKIKTITTSISNIYNKRDKE